jgi:hypothetical protein
VFELSASSESSLLTTNPGRIHLYLTVQRFPSCVHHGPAELVQHHPCGLVTGQAQLALQKQGRHASLVRGHQGRGPEPVRQRNFRAMKNCARSQPDLVATLAALPAPLVQQLLGFCVSAARTNEAIRPTTSGQIPLAGFLRGTVGLKLAQRFWERGVRQASTLHIGGLLKQPDEGG